MRVAMITSCGERCGIAAYSAALLDTLSEHATVDRIPVPGSETGERALVALAERANAAEIVHIQHEFTFFNGYLPGQTTFFQLVRRLRRPRVITAHSVLPLEALMHVADERRPARRLVKRVLALHPGLRRAVERDPYALADAVIVHTSACAARLTRAGVPPDRIVRIPAGIPVLAEDGPLPDELEAFLVRPTIVMPGYVTPNKGYEVALAALQHLPAEVGLLIAGGTRVPGEAPYLGKLAEEISANKLDARVRITGYLPEPQLAAVLRRATLAAVPHREATGSYSVTLPLAAGRAIVASDLPCFREIAEASGGVALVPPEDASALARAVEELLGDGLRRAALEAASRRYAASRTWPAVGERTVALYQRLLAAEARGRQPAPYPAPDARAAG